MDERLKDLNLLVLYLSGWEEDSRKKPGQKLFRSWKGYPFEILNEFEQRQLITQHRKSKSVVFTEAGKRGAEELMRKYFV
ncbi:MAG: transposase [Candidatus Aminicenantes bacterium]|nr:transposase [Candidatus Aminicenantes bacterium]